MRLFWRKGRKIRSTERFKTSAILIGQRSGSEVTNRQASKRGRRVCVRVHRATDLEKNTSSNLHRWSSFWVVGPLFISTLLFHLSRALLGAWRFSLFRSVYSSFHNRLDLIREPAFYWCFILFSHCILDCFIICKNEKVLFVLVQ